MNVNARYQVVADVDQYRELFASMVAAIESGAPESEFDAIEASMISNARALADVIDEWTITYGEEINQSVQQAEWQIIGTAILALVLGLIIALVISRQFSQPISQLVKVMTGLCQ